MTLPFACHVFAHKDGRYQTVSSFGVDASEIKALEQFFFGQTNDARYLHSLSTEPGIIWRRIDGRIALTRVTQGSADSDGRSTLSFETLLDADRETPLARSVAEVVLGNWEMTSTGATVTPSPIGQTLPLNPAAISNVTLAVRDGKRILHPAKEFSLRDVAMVIESCAEEPGFSLCYKSLNDRAPVTVNLVSRNISERTMSTSPPAKTNPLPRADRSVRGQPAPTASNTLVLVAVCAVLVLQVISLWSSARASSAPATSDTMQAAIIDHQKTGNKHLARELKEVQKFLSAAIAARKELASKNASAIQKAEQDRLASGKKLDALTVGVDRLRKDFETLQFEALRTDVVLVDKAIRQALAWMEDFEKQTRAALDEIKKRLPSPTMGNDDPTDSSTDSKDNAP